MDTASTISRVMDEDKEIYTAVMGVIDGMTDGDNIAIDTLTEQVSGTVSRPVNEVKPFVSHIARATEVDGIGYVSPGRFGGYRKGARPAKKSTSKKTTSTTDTN